MEKQKWYKILLQFWSENLANNVKKISIGFGSFIIVVITTCTLPIPLFLASIYGAGISFGSMTIMSIFGKNGNGHTESIDAIEKDDIEHTVIKNDAIEVIPKEKIILP